MPTCERVGSIAELEALYGTPPEAALRKVADRLTPAYARMLEAAPFVALATGGADGFDCSPRGDRGQVAFALDERRLAIPDRRGNNRLDTLRNIVADGRVAALFLLPGCDETLRVNGRAHLTTHAALRERFTVDGRAPVTIIVIEIVEVYFQCARALLRSDLWNARVDRAALPSAGEMAKSAWGAFDAEGYDAALPARQATTLY